MQYDEALSDYNAAFEVSESDEQKALACVNVADIQRVAQSKLSAAHCSIDEALTYCTNGSLMHAKAVDQRGLVFVAQKDYPSAIDAYKRARVVCEDLLNSETMDADTANRFGQIIHHLGVAYILLDNPEMVDEAYDSQINALAIFSELGDRQGVVNTVSTLGKIAMIEKDYGEAIKKYEQARGILEETGYSRAITSLSLNLAEAHLQEEPEQATPYLKRFRDSILKKELTDQDIQGMQDQFNNMARLYDSSTLTIDGFEQVREIFN